MTNDHLLFLISGIIIIFGAVVIIMLLHIGKSTHKQKIPDFDNISISTELMKEIINNVKRYTFSEIHQNELEKRNELWHCFGQIIITALIVSAITVLLLLGKISPEAGVPILSALSGFTLAKTVDVVRNKREL